MGRPLLVGAAVLLVAAAVGTAVWAVGDDGGPAAEPVATSANDAAVTPADQLNPTIAATADGAAPGLTTGTATTAPGGTANPGGTTNPGSTTNPGGTADPDLIRTQGRELDQLLAQSKASRDKLVSANDDVFRCSGMDGAIRRLRQVGAERGAQRTALASLDLSAVPRGEEMRTALDEALDHSVKADGHYVEWAEERRGNGCRNTAAARRHQNLGDQESKEAGTAKTRFLELWNPVAADLALPTRDRQGI